MTNELADKAHEVRMLTLEVQKLELENRITQLKAEPPIDEECVGCCKVVDVAANLQKELDEKDKMLEKYGREILCLRDMYDGMWDKVHALEAELSVRKEDSEVLMKVVEIVKNWDDSTGRAFPTLYKIVDLLTDYLDAPEGPPETTIDEPQEVTVTFAYLELP